MKRNLLESAYLVTKKVIKLTHINFNVFYQVYLVLNGIKNFFKYGDYYFFKGVSIENSTYCNRRCPYCPIKDHPPESKLMDRRIFDQLILGLQKIHYVGPISFSFYNEPLLDKRLPDLVKAVKSALPKCIIRVFSNGDFLTMPLADELIRSGVHEFLVTAHDKDPARIYERLNPIKSKYPDHLTLQYLHDSELHNRGGLVKVLKLARMKKCTVAVMNLTVDFNGNVLLCCNDFFRKHAFGNIMETDIKSIWNKPAYRRIRQNLIKGIVDLPICKKCMDIE